MVDGALAARLMRSAADLAMTYPFKVWGFGEEICLEALIRYGRETDDTRAAEFVVDLVRPWCQAKVEAGEPLSNADHVAPGVVLLDLYEATGDEVYLAASLRLGSLHRSFDEVRGVAVHRPDLEGLSHLIWVDCMALDGPFLARLAGVTGDASWSDLAVRTMTSYAAALMDDHTTLFRHGFDTRTGLRSDCCWARGNGWAMHGLLATVLALHERHLARKGLTELLAAQVAAVMELQTKSGHWHTVLDDPSTPIEASAAAFFASAVLRARRHGVLAPLEGPRLDAMLERAVAAVVAAAPEGALPTSYATPVGTRETYAKAPTGTFPWGQGPLLLTLLEARIAAAEGTRVKRPGGSPVAGSNESFAAPHHPTRGVMA